MPFVLKKSATYRWPVEYKTPADDGKYDRQQFTVEFKRIDQQRIDEIYAAAKAAAAAAGDFEDAALAEEVVLGWSGVQADSGEAFDFTPNNRAVLLALPGMRSAILTAFFESIRGAARKN